MSKEKTYKEAAQYYHQPFALLREQRVRQLQQRMGIDGTGILLHIYLLLRQCNGKYPLDSIFALARGRLQEKKIRSALNDFDLFTIENGIVQLQTGLSAAELKPNSTVAPKDKPGIVRQRLKKGYDDTLFPSELREMDETALDKSVQEIRDNNATELSLQNTNYSNYPNAR